MILNTTNTIRFKFVNGTFALQNKQYKMYMKNDTDWREIYNGLTFFNSRGESELYLDPILRDLIFRWETEYYDDQLFRPINFISDVQNQVIDPIERHNTFMTTYIKVDVIDNGVVVLSDTKEVTGAYSLFYESTNFELKNPFNESDLGNFQNLSIYTKVLPRIPNIDSDKFWLGLNFSINKNYGNTNQVYLKTPQGFIEIKREGYGNYACAYSLSELKNNLNPNLDLTNQTILMSSVPNRLVKGDVPIAVFDRCPADYYVAFTTNYGWSSWGFKGNTTEKIEQNNEIITNSFGHSDVIWNKTKSTFNLYTQLVTREEYHSLMGLLQAYKIYVYDVKKDKGTWCTVSNKTISDIATKNHKAKIFNIELIENKEQIA